MTVVEATQSGLSPAGRARVGITVWCSGLALAVLAVAVVFGRWLVPYDPRQQDLLQAGSLPSGDHWLGTDGLGRDVFSKVVAGALPALSGPLVVAAGAAVAGTLVGLLAGYRGGWLDAAISRVVDVLYALPALLVILVLVGLVGQGYWSAVVLLAVLYAPADVRLFRSAVIAQRHLPYVEAAVAMGLPQRRVMFVHVLPNILPSVVAGALLDFVSALVGLSSLSFLGVGTPPGSADWGRMLAENRGLLDANPWAAVAPALLIIIAAVSVTVLGDWAYARLQKGVARDD